MAAWGMELRITEDESGLVKRGEPLFADGGAQWIVHPSDMLLQRGKGRFPFETRHCLGVIELERDRRRRHGQP